MSPAILAWLTTKGLIHNFALVVANIADGATPAKHLKVLRPIGAFRTVVANGKTFVDPRGYQRYAQVAEAIESVDPTAAATLYATLKPRVDEAYRGLGSPEPFDRTLERAIVAMLDTPIVTDAIVLKPTGIVYSFADHHLESLTAAQRLLLRMGPSNGRRIHARLRDIALALGIPANHLPNEDVPPSLRASGLR